MQQDKEMPGLCGETEDQDGDGLHPDWSDEQKAYFWRIYRHMIRNKAMFAHPSAPEVEDGHWVTTAWNSAWVAVAVHAGCEPMEHIDEDGRTLAAEDVGRLQ